MKRLLLLIAAVWAAGIGLVNAQSATCADVNSGTSGTSLTLSEVTCVFVSSDGKNCYVQDATGTTLLYKANFGLVPGDVVSGLQGKVSVYNNLPEFVPTAATIAATGLTVTHGAAPVIADATAAPVEADINKVLMFRNVNLGTVSGSSKTTYTATFMGSNVAFYNQFGVALSCESSKTYDILGCVAKYKSTLQVYIGSIVEHHDEAQPITVRLFKTAQICSGCKWPSVYLYAWDANQNPLLGTWPGTQVSLDNDGWYSYTFPVANQNVNIIWNSGINGYQTVDITNVMGSTSYALGNFNFSSDKYAASAILANTPTTPQNCAYVSANTGSNLELNEVTLVYKKAPYYYIQDASGSMLLYSGNSAYDQLTLGDKIQGMFGTSKLYNGYAEFEPMSYFGDLTITSGAAPEIPAATAAPTMDDLHKVFLYENLSVLDTFYAGTKKNIVAYMPNGSSVIFRNEWGEGYSFDPSKTYDIVGCVSAYGNTVQVAAAEISVHGGDTPVAPDTIVLGFQPPMCWPSVYVYAWDENENALLGSWPGELVTASNGWFYKTIISQGTVNYIWNSGNTNLQTADLSAPASKCERLSGMTQGTYSYVYTTSPAECGSAMPELTITDKSFAQALAIGQQMPGNIASLEYYRVKGVVGSVSTSAENVVRYKNCDFMISDPTGASNVEMKAFRMKWLTNADFTSADQIPVQGDTVTLVAPLYNFADGSVIELYYGYIESITRSAIAVDTVTADVCAAYSACAALNMGASSYDYYRVTGVVSEIMSGDDATKVERFWMDCGENRLQAYNVVFQGADLAMAGDTVEILGKLQNYNGTMEIGGQAWIKGKYVEPAPQPVENPITVGFQPTTWENVYLHYWNTNEEKATTNWPGKKLEPDENGWYYYTFNYDTIVNYIWNNGAGIQTQDLQTTTGSCLREGELVSRTYIDVVNVECGSALPQDTTLDEDGLVMRLYPSPAVEKWEHVYAYVWMPSGEPIFGNFPGKLATVDSLGWPTVTLPSGVTDVKLLWSDGTNANQTEDVEGIMTSTCFALGARNSYGRFTFVQSEIGSYDMDCTLPIEKKSIAEALALPRNTLVKMKDLTVVWTKTYDNTSYYYAKDTTGSICVKVYYGSDGPQPGMVVGDLYGYIDNDGLTPYFIPCTSPRDMVISQGAMPELPLMVNEPTAADVNKVFRLQNVNMDGVRWTTTRSRSSFGLYLPSGAFVNLRNFFGDALTSPDDGTTYNMTGAVALTNDEIQVYVGDFEVNAQGDTTGHDTIPEVEPIVLRVSKASVDAAGWNEVHLYVWSDVLQNYAIHGAWPGDVVALDSTGNWYTAEIDAAYAPFKIIWGNGGNGAGNQTYDILDVAASGCYSVRFDPEYMSEAMLYGITVDCDVLDSVPEYVEDTTAHMVYITYNLTGLGNYMDSIQVAHGGSVTLPEPPQFEGYHFVFWEGLYDGSNVLNNVKRDMYMRATYHINLPEDEPSNPITVRLEASSVPEEWDNVYIFSWNTGDEKSTLWPGTPMRLVDDWYSYTFPAGVENVDFLFNANNAEELGFANQTVDVDDVNSNYCFRIAPQKNELAYYMVYLAECGTDTTGHDTIPEAEPITLRVSKASVEAIGWDTVHLYVWSDELGDYAINGAWPGNEVALDSTGNWYTEKVSSAYAPFNIIWGNGHDGGHNQTINIEYVSESTCYSVRINPELPGGKLRAEELVDCAVEDSVPVFVPDTSIHTVYYFSGLTGLIFDSVQVVHGSPVPMSTANVPAVAGYHFYSWRVSPGDFYDYVWRDMLVEAAYQLDMPADTVAPIVIRLKASSVPADWETVNIMAWTAYGDPSEIGYGAPMTLDTLGWYTYIFNSEYESVDFLFNNGEWNGDNQSVDVFGVTSSQCLQLAAPLDTIEGKAYPMVYLADCEGVDTIQVEGMTIRFMDEQYQGGWQKGYIDLFAWHNVNGVDVPVLGEWPGASMSFDSVTGWWSYTLPAGYSDLNFVISSGTVQTSDILHVSESSCYQLSNYVGISNYGQYVNNVKQIDCATNPSDYHIVYFMSKDNEYILWSGYVLDGDSAIAPEAPEIVGFRFLGWSADFSNVTENLTITAIYEAYEIYVYMVDWDGYFICWGHFPYGSSMDISILDDFIPTREGYEFIGWSNDLQNLKETRFLVALYRPIVSGNTSVIYVDRVGGQITQQEVDLYLPAAPVYEGYTFVRWDVLGGELSEGIRIQAVYQYDGTGTDAPSVDGEELQPRKEFRQGIIYVLKPDGAVYSVAGQRIK